MTIRIEANTARDLDIAIRLAKRGSESALWESVRTNHNQSEKNNAEHSHHQGDAIAWVHTGAVNSRSGGN